MPKFLFLAIMLLFIATTVFSQVTIVADFQDPAGKPVSGLIVEVSGTGVTGTGEIINGRGAIKVTFKTKFKGSLNLKVYKKGPARELVNIIDLKGRSLTYLSFPFEYTGISKVSAFYLNANASLLTTKSPLTAIKLNIRAQDLEQTHVAAPKLSPASGQYTAPVTISMVTATSGAAIKYTTDGSDPAGATARTYSAPFTIQDKTIIKACAQKPGYLDSLVITQEYVFDFGPCSQPVITPEAGTYTDPQTITITCQTQGATIKYIIDGVEQTYSGPIAISTDTTISAYALKNNYQNSPFTEATYVFTAAGAPLPDISIYEYENEIIEYPEEDSPAWIVQKILELGIQDKVDQALTYFSSEYLYNYTAISSFKRYNWVTFVKRVGKYILDQAKTSFKITLTDLDQSGDQSLKYFIYMENEMPKPITLERQADGPFLITGFGL